MKFELSGAAEIIMSNPYGLHDYFAWPTVTRLKNGKIAVGASGFRIDHVCPFGKGVMCISDDECKTYTPPAVIIDTFLDDRDVGLCPFGESGLILNSFNNAVEFQHEFAGRFYNDPQRRKNRAYRDSYLDLVPSDKEKEQIGATYRISHDNGKTFGKVFVSPINSPHGPIELQDKSILWVGEMFWGNDGERPRDMVCIKAYSVDPESGEMTNRGSIPNVDIEGMKLEICEPYAVQLADGRLICHIRVQGGKDLFTIYQSESDDNGFTWTQPHQILPDYGGAPSHILVHSSGTLIATYGFRRLRPTYSVKAIFSYDNGETWQDEQVIYENTVTGDIGYPSSVELADGGIATIFYAHPDESTAANILQQKWYFEK